MSDHLGLVVVTGAGGFIGGNLVADLRARDHKPIRAVDIKPFDEWYQRFDDVENLSLDLNLKENCEQAAQGASDIYNLAANMGGMGFIEHNKALCMLSVLINTHMLQAAVKYGVQRFFYSSSACVYSGDKQKDLRSSVAQGRGRLPRSRGRWLWLGKALFRAHVPPLPGGLRSLHSRGPFSQRLRALGYLVRRAGEGPAAICRKVIEAKVSGKHEIDIWGPGNQTRSFMFIDDCLKGIDLIMNSEILGADQSRIERGGDDKSAGRYRGGNCRNQVEAPLQSQRAHGCEWAEQR